MTRRLFVAVVPPAAVHQHLADAVEPLRDTDRSIRWTPVEQWHLTLVFAAAVPESAVGDLVARLARAAGRRPAMTLRLRGAGAFPRTRRARVLWIGVDTGGERLPRLATAVQAATARAGIPVESRRFRAHLTLARLSEPADLSAVVQPLAEYRGPSWVAGEVRLVESHLGQGAGGRPRYETVAVFPLRAATG